MIKGAPTAMCPGQVVVDGKLVCRCLKVSVEQVKQAVEVYQLSTVEGIVRTTGAGDGCTACRRKLGQYLPNSAV